MKILNAQQIREWDEYTIQHEPIASIDLMERAARKCYEWITAKGWTERPFFIFCGKGNNGGDGLAIARMLLQSGYSVSVYILESGKKGTDDFQTNLQRLHDVTTSISFIQSADQFPQLPATCVIIDALFGSGLSKPLEGTAASLVQSINQSSSLIVSIDLPSGLFIDRSSKGNSVSKATYTITFQCFKLALLIQENAGFTGVVQVLDIGLHPQFPEGKNFSFLLTDEKIIQQLFKPRNPFSHKGTFGHALLIAGSYGKMGAAVLAARACLRSGTGLLSCYIPACGYQIMQTAVPEAMVITDESEKVLSRLPDETDKYTVIGIGPGMGTADATQKLISFVIRRYQKPLLIDADGLNCLSLQKELLQQLPALSILTPHPKEFDRLFGVHANDFDRMATAIQKSRELNVIIVLKGHHTQIALPGGVSYFNNTGNAGLAKGGTGDVLSGIITALLAQGYEPGHAAILGVYLHGLAGDLAAGALSQEAMTAGDVVRFLSKAFLGMTSSGKEK